MKKVLSCFLLMISLLAFSVACHRRLPLAPPPIVPTPTFTPTYFVPTSTPGCYEVSALPVTQYSYPNPFPVATPFWTPGPLQPQTTNGSVVITPDNNGAYVLRSISDWTTYWGDLGLAAPAPPTNFSSEMVFVPGSYGLIRICYTNSNVVVYQGSGGGGADPCINCGPGIFPIGTVTPVPTPTAIPTPSTLPRNLYLIPASNLPVSFISSYVNAA